MIAMSQVREDGAKQYVPKLVQTSLSAHLPLISSLSAPVEFLPFICILLKGPLEHGLRIWRCSEFLQN